MNVWSWWRRRHWPRASSVPGEAVKKPTWTAAVVTRRCGCRATYIVPGGQVSRAVVLLERRFPAPAVHSEDELVVARASEGRGLRIIEDPLFGLPSRLYLGRN